MPAPAWPPFPFASPERFFSGPSSTGRKPVRSVSTIPCVAGGYLLTVLGLLFPGQCQRLIGSDIDEPALEIARKNLSLLSPEGLASRRQELKRLYETYGKASHQEALHSLDRLAAQRSNLPLPQTHCFRADLLGRDALAKRDFQADIVLTDLPYGQLVGWQGGHGNETETLLHQLVPVLTPATIVALVMSKQQAIPAGWGRRLERFQVGKRKIVLLRYEG